MGCKFVHRLNIPLYESSDVSYHEPKLETYCSSSPSKPRFVSVFFKDIFSWIEQMRIKNYSYNMSLLTYLLFANRHVRVNFLHGATR